MLHSQKLRLVALVLSSALVVGCSGDGIHTVPVYGKVTAAGREMPKVCRLFFNPTSTGVAPLRPSVVQTEPDGSYAVKAFKDSDGLLPGTYRVVVSYFDLKPGGNPNSEGGWVEHKHDAGELVVDADADEIEHNIEVPAKS